PIIVACVVSAPAVRSVFAAVAVSAPDDHYTTGPHCRVIRSGIGHAGGGGGRPTICCPIVSPAGVKDAADVADSTPDDHFAAGPHCRVRESAIGRAGGAGS